MPKQGATKEEILKLISEGEKTLSGISMKLSLAPSTVSKHIHDLEAAGLIEQEDDTHIKKWKYYRIAQRNDSDTDIRNYNMGEGISFNRFNKGMVLALVVVSLLSVFAAAAILQPNQSSAVAYVPIGITDPPQVPYGTQALYINYSSLAVLVSNSTSSSWINVNSSGTLDLLGLVNQSQVIGSVPLRASQHIKAIAFNITSSSIVIGNVTYGVHVQGSRISADLAQGTKLNSSSGILIDFFPVVTPIYTQNSTSFIMLPSMKAITFPKNDIATQAGGYITQKQPIPEPYAIMLRPLNDSVSVSNPALLVSGNTISLNAYVQNDGAYNVTVLCVMLTQKPRIAWQSNQIQPYSYGAHTIVGPVHGTMRVSGWYHEYNNTIDINADGVYTAGSYYGARSVQIVLNHTVNVITINTGSELPTGHMFFREGVPYASELFWLNLVVGRNGTLLMPQYPIPTRYGGITGPPGYTLAAHSGKEFSYNGSYVSLPWQIAQISGNYTLVVVTDRGIALANITAT